MDIAGYKIEKLIAEGGMADVYLATQKSLERRVALKLLQKFVKSEQSDRFLNEGRIIASLYHSNIITIYDIGAVDGQHYISMEYLEGGDLENRIRKGMSPEVAIDLIATIGNCLELVHSKGIIHRDIKPGNILFRRDETPVLSDFGIAKQLNQDTSLTMDGTAMGSPDYLSPEQAECKPLDGRTDIYSLGIVFYEMLTGQTPYQGNSYIEIVMSHIRAPIPTLPSHLEQYQVLLERMISKDPEKRFESVTDMVEYIDRFFRCVPRKSLITRIVSWFHKRHKKSPVITAAAKTIQIPMDEVSNSESEDESANEYMASISTRKRSSSPTLKRALLATAMLVLITSLYWMPNKTPMEEPARNQTSKYKLASAEQAFTASITTTDSARSLFMDDMFIDPSKEQVKKYLRKANSSLKKYQLTSPKGDNAYFYYKKVINLEPRNKIAKQGMVKIANRYARLAELEIDRYEYSKAEHYVDTGLRIQPRHKKLRHLQERTNAVKDIPTRMFKGIESVFK